MNEEIKNTDTVIDEKRAIERKKIKLNKIFKTEIQLQNELKSCFVYIVDISEAGMRIHIDFALPEGITMPIKFYLDESLDIKARLVWQKVLVGGMYIAGIEFTEISKEDKEKISRFIEKYSPEGKRKAFRLNRVLAVEVKLAEIPEKFYALTMDLSTSGMRITHERMLPEGVEIPFRILLDLDKPPIEVTGKVAWQKESSWGGYTIGVEFAEVSEKTAARINQFIDLAFNGKLDDQIIAPQEGIDIFEEEKSPEENSKSGGKK